MTTRSRGHVDIAKYTPADCPRSVSQIAPCPDCGGALRFTTNGAGSLVEICDRCADRARARHNHKPSHTRETHAMPTATAPRADPPHSQGALGKPALVPLAPPVVGKPCPHCGQKVKARLPCRRCKKNPPAAGRRLCDTCAKPKNETRFCVKCGTRFEFVFGQTMGKGQSQYDTYRCPAHRKATT